MINSNSWLQQTAQKLAANSFQPLPAEVYQAQGFKYAVRRSRFELTKFGMAEYFFTFAEIPNLTPDVLRQFSSASFRYANANKSVPLPNGLFVGTFCFAVAITAHLGEETQQFIRFTEPATHWGAFEMRIAFDLATGGLYYYEKTPLWGGAYYAGFRREVTNNLS